MCKRFFLGTLATGHFYIQHALGNSQDGAFLGEERRGKHQPGNETKEEDRARVKQHIESIPALQSYLCRRSSHRKFLGGTLTINRLYEMYCETCREEGKKPVSVSMYRKIFKSDYNLSFHEPQKDHSLVCSQDHEAKKEKRAR